MKKMLVVILLIAIGLMGCTVPGSDPDPYITFEEVSRPYLDTYREPEDGFEYISGGHHSITWWWWSKGFMVTFLDNSYDGINGWKVDSTRSFDPIY